ncbi:MAG: AAA family ATPase [Proteobacteria bacterium]|nr:AAA family ATPase [Pseudomonadota bacterium]
MKLFAPNRKSISMTMQPSEEMEIVALLSAPATYACDGRVDVIETHCARIFLACDEAFKVKKRVKFPFVDFTTLETRFAACQREIEINQPHAPGLYLGLRRISRSDDGRLNLQNIGETVEWVVHMRRFDQSAVLAYVADRGPLPSSLPHKLASMVAHYHRSSPVSLGSGAERMHRLVEQLTAELSASGSLLSENDVSTFGSLARDHLLRHARLLDARAASGAVRRCHGDLHLGNIVTIGAEPVPFDALEFNEELATTDVLYDLAFLLMDLDHRGLRGEANAVLNAYVAEAPLGSEIAGLGCLPLFLACRAAVRAVVFLERSRQRHEESVRSNLLGQAGAYIELSVRYLQPAPALNVAIGGLSGSGKSTVARALAPSIGLAPGAIHLRSDIERKRLAGYAEEHRLSSDYYTAEMSQIVYDKLIEKSVAILASGHSVVTDAVYARPDERTAIADATKHAGGCFIGFWLDAPAEQLIARVDARTGDVSDATASVVRFQLELDVGAISWHRLDASQSSERVIEAALAILENFMARFERCS